MSRAAVMIGVVAVALTHRSAGAQDTAARPPRILAADCDRGDQAACTALGYHVISDQAFPPDAARALDLWRRACTSGHLPGCLPYGQLLLTGYQSSDVHRYVSAANAADTIPARRSEGRKVLAGACDGGYAPACDALGATHLRKKRERPEACRLFRRACAAGDQGGCWSQVAHCPTRIAVTGPGTARRGGELDIPRLEAFAPDRDGLVIVERAEAGRPVRTGHIDRAGRLTWMVSLPPGRWSVAACSDGRGSLFSDGGRLLQVPRAGPSRWIPLPAPPTLPAGVAPPAGGPPDPFPELLACLEDGTAVVVRAVVGQASDEDHRSYLTRHPERFVNRESAVLQQLTLSVHPHDRPRDVERGRALAGRLAAELRAGKPWADVVALAKEGWYSMTPIERRFAPGEIPPPPPDALALKPGAVLGPIERLEPVWRGRLARMEGNFTLWRQVSRTDARVLKPEEALARARTELGVRFVQVLIAAPSGPVDQRRFALYTTPIGAPTQLGPLVPVDGGFALLGDHRQMWKAGRWSGEAPLLAALGPAPVLDAIRDGGRVVVLTDGRVRAFALDDGRVLAEAGPERITAGALYPRRLGLAGPDRLLLVSADMGRVGVVALDEAFALRWVDQFSFDTNGRPPAFAPSGLWLLANDGGRVLGYQQRQLTEYRLVPVRGDDE